MRRNSPTLVPALLIAALLAAAPLAAQQAPTDPYTQGVQALQAGDYTQALQALQQAVQQTPSNEPAWYALGTARLEQPELDLPGALEAFRRALELEPNRPGTRLQMGRVFEMQGAYEEAFRLYQEEVRRTRGEPQTQARVALGRAYYKAGRYEDAATVLPLATTAEPNFVEPRYWEGLALTELGRYPQAIATFRAAREVLQDFQDLSLRLGRLTAERQREREETEEMLAQKYGEAERFVHRLGLWPDLNKALGRAHLANGQYIEARNAYRGALDRGQGGSPSDPEVYAFVAASYLADAKSVFHDDGMLHTAIAILRSAERSVQQALDLDPDAVEAWITRGELYLFQADTYASDPDRGVVSHTYEDAVAAFEKALSARPDHVPGLVGLARTHLHRAQDAEPGSQDAQRDLERAQGLLQQAMTLAPRQAEHYVLLAQVALEEGQYEPAKEYAQRALTYDPQAAAAFNALGLAGYWTTELSQAVRDLRRATELAPRNPAYYYDLGNGFFQMQSWYLALREYRRAVEHIPTAAMARTAKQRADILYQMALCYHETQRHDEEISALNDALALEPAYFPALLQLARAHAARQEYRAAQRALDQAVQRTDQEGQISVAKTLSGQIHEADGNPHAAAVAYAEAVSLDAANLVAQQALGRLTGRQG